MMTNIEELFSQIVSSEQKARERKCLINEVKTKIQKCQSEIEDVEEDTARLSGLLELKVQQYNSLKLEINWETNQKRLLEEQKETLTAKCNELKEEINRLEVDLSAEEEQFSKDARQFNLDNDLLSNSVERQQMAWREEIQNLKKEQEKLEEDLNSYKQCQSDVEILSTQKAEQMVQVERLTDQITELKGMLEAEKEELVKLQEEKEVVSEIHRTDPEFQRLQRELNSVQSSEMESICSSLEQELQSLRQAKWQREIQNTVDKQHLTKSLRVKGKIRKTLQQDDAAVMTCQQPTPSAAVISNYNKAQLS